MLALGVAGANVAVSRLLERAAAGRQSFLKVQAAGFLLRASAIFGAASWVWRVRHRAAEVVLFIVTAAVAQMAGQIYLLLKDTEDARSGRRR